MGRIVGIDFGTVRIGVAISDERKIIARSLVTVQMGKDIPSTIELIRQQLLPYFPIEAIVVGNPLLLNGKEGEMALKAKTFGEFLSKILDLTVIFWDERLTSSQVERMLKGAEVSRKKRAKLSDQLSAVAILQNYLDSLSLSL